MKRAMAFGAAAKKGDWPVQEDAFWVDPVARVFVLADGCGGAGVGDVVAARAVQETGEFLSTDRELDSDSPQLSPEEALMQQAFLRINSELIESNSQQGPEERGGVSLLAVQFHPSGRAVLGSCGACGAVILRNGRAIELIRPQTFAVMQGESVGAVDPRFGCDFPLTMLGMFDNPDPELRTCHFQANDTLLLYTEGMLAGNWELLQQAALITAHEDPGASLEEAAREILSLAQEGQKWHKNSSLILISCTAIRNFS